MSFDLFCSKVLTSADRRNLTSKGLGRELLLSYLPRQKVLNGRRVDFVISF